MRSLLGTLCLLFVIFFNICEITESRDSSPSSSVLPVTTKSEDDVPGTPLNLKPPRNVTLEAANSTSIIIRWEPPIDGENGVITGYRIQYRKHAKRQHPLYITIQGDQRIYRLNGLEKHVVYNVRIAAKNVNGTGPWSESFKIETYDRDLDETKVPEAPVIIETKAMSDSVNVTWSPPEDRKIKVSGYSLGWGKGYPNNHTEELDSEQRYYTIKFLEPLSEYVIALRARNAIGKGIPTYVTVRTIEDSVSESADLLIPPVGLKAIVLSASTMLVYWTDSTLPKNQYVTDERYYVVRYTPFYRNNNPRYKYHNSTDSNCTIEDLKPNTRYEFTVKLVKGKKESGWSTIVHNETQEAAPSRQPRDLTVQTVPDHPTAVMLHWLPPKRTNAQIIAYVIFYTTDNTKRDRDWRVEAVTGDQSEMMIKTLQPDTTYYFKIQARNVRGYGQFSSTVSFKTPAIEQRVDQSEGTSQDSRLPTLPESYTIFPNHNVAYKIYNKSLPWDAARDKCRADGGDLAIADTVDKIRNVQNMDLLKDDWIFVGIWKPALSTEWKTVKEVVLSTSSIPWTSWTRPDKILERTSCAAMALAESGLGTFDCSYQASFVCEIPDQAEIKATTTQAAPVLPVHTVTTVQPELAPTTTSKNSPLQSVELPRLGIRYTLHGDRLTHHDAREGCFSDGGLLAVVDSFEKINVISKILGEESVHVGIRVSSVNFEEWVGDSDGETLKDLPWTADNPHPAKCAALKKDRRGLEETLCSNRLQYICEIRKINE